MKITVCLIVVLFLVGCGAKNEVTAIHLGAQGNWNPFIPATADGCYIGTKGSMKGITLTYQSGDCLIEVKGKTAE
jgi:hypothetical protein